MERTSNHLGHLPEFNGKETSERDGYHSKYDAWQEEKVVSGYCINFILPFALSTYPKTVRSNFHLLNVNLFTRPFILPFIADTRFRIVFVYNKIENSKR